MKALGLVEDDADAWTLWGKVIQGTRLERSDRVQRDKSGKMSSLYDRPGVVSKTIGRVSRVYGW